ncbi:hypothetical protein niasHS_012375 [Heterodera schachtii]|uniref:histone acetyltransferase n=1 Tax=Heterodera schachtii TaxID=97005 RepID=A0ABD2IPX4_HETSC
MRPDVQGSIQLKKVALRVFWVQKERDNNTTATTTNNNGSRTQNSQSKMSSGEDRQMEQEDLQQSTVGTGTKRKLAAQASFDDDLDLDGFSELDKLEPAVAAAAVSGANAEQTNNGGTMLQNGTMMLNGGMAPQQQPPPPPHSSSSATAGGTPQQQQSVLQELLLTQSTTSATMHNNSPRPVGSFTTKSPMPSVTQMGGHGTMPQNMSPMGMMGGPNVVGGSARTAHQLTAQQQQQFRHQQMAAAAAAAAAHHGTGGSGFDPSNPMVSQGGAGGAYMTQQQQFNMYQHQRQMYGSAAGQRLPPGAMPPQTSSNGGMRQQQPVSFNAGGGPSSNGATAKGNKQQQHQQPPPQHPAMIMLASGGNAPTPPGRPVMIGQPGPMGAQPPPFDTANASAAHPYSHHQHQSGSIPMLSHTMNGPPSSSAGQRGDNGNNAGGGGFMMGPGGGAAAHHLGVPSAMVVVSSTAASSAGQPPPTYNNTNAAMGSGVVQHRMGPHGQSSFVQPQQQQNTGGGQQQHQPMLHGPPMDSHHHQQQQGPPLPMTIAQRQSAAVQQQQQSSANPNATGGAMMVAQSPLGAMMNSQQQSMNNANSGGPPQMRGGGIAQQQQMLGAGGGGGQPQDPEKRKLIQQQLVLLLHAHKCQQIERSELRQDRAPCTLPYCSVMKGVLEHMVGCSAGRQCQYAHCASSRQIIAHWKNCHKDDCPVCNMVKRYTTGTAADRRQADIMLSAVGFPSVTLPQQTIQGAIGQQQPSSSASTCSGPSSVGMNNTSTGPGPSAGVGPTSVGSVGAGPMSSFGSPPSTSSAVNNLLDGYTPNTNPFLSINPPNRVGQSPHQMGVGAPSQMVTVVGFGTSGDPLPPPEPPSQPRDWHASITPDLRNHLVGKLVKAIFPYPDPAAARDQRIRDLLTYARKVEKDMFEAANDKEAYYHMLAEKIYKIQKELQEKKNRRLNEQQQLAQQQQLQGKSDQQQSLFDDSGAGLSHQLNAMGMPMSGPGSSSQQQFGAVQQQMPFSNKDIKQEYREQQPQMLNFVDAAASAPSASSGAVPPLKRIKMEESQQPNTCTSMPSTSGGGSSAELVSIKHEVGGTTSTTAGSKATTTSSSSASGGLFPPNASTTGETRRSTTPKDVKPSTSTAPTVQEPIVRDPKVFEANELRQHLVPVWNQLMQFEPACIPFRYPVDPEQLNIPDYFDIIKNPMDLQTIKANLDQGKYKNPWEFCEHMWLMFENAWLYNRKNTKIHKWCTQLSELFVEEINPVMRRMGYCCGQKLSFTPLVQFCFGITKNNAACVIARDQPYFMYESSSTGFGVTVAERYIYCVKCFEALPDEGINLNENTPDPPNWIPKPMFQKMKNDQIDMEPFEQCQICDRKWHRICALHSNKIHPGGFVCEQCRVEKNRTRQENKFTAKKLPHYNLSRHIEDRVNNFLRRKLTDSDPEVEVIIRVLCSADKEVEVKPAMLKKYASEGYTDRFPYRSKAVFAFEVVKDPDTGASHEVCFFGLYVQEYGTNCQQPNQRRVYIAYLDSVHFFQPRSLRTSVYYEILLGYLDYAKTLGYTMAHIWACPPSEGDDYIFHCHPPEQKIPKPKRLQDWYKTMLNNGQMEGTVYSYKDIYNQARDDGLDTPMKLPYFEGDYWPRIIDECIIGAEKEEEQEKRMKQHQQFQSAEEGGGVGGVGSAATASLSDDDTFQTDDGFPVVKQKQQPQQQQKASSNKKKNNLKKSAQNSKKKTGLSTGNPVVDKLFQQLEKHRDVFFTIRLFSAQEEQRVLAEKPRIEDPDPLVGCELMDTRDNFLAKSREEHWEFSQLRRAKWSSLNFCYTLHTQEPEGVKGVVNYTCNVCEKPATFHCNQCEDYDLCDQCRAKTDHPHEMEKLVLGDDQKSADSAASAASRNDSVKKCITSLVHACICRDANCRRGTCHKMKKVIQHTKHCKRRQTVGSNCAVCKQLIALCCYHAKHCTQAKCQVPFCLQIRQKLQEQKRSQNRQAERMMQRRMMKLQSVGAAAMNGSGGAATVTSQMTSSVPTPSSVSSASMQQQQQQSPWAQPPQSPRQQQIGACGPQQQPFGAPPMQMSGMMMSPNAMPPQQQRLNGPMGAAAAYHQMHTTMGGPHQQMINSPPMAQYQQAMGGGGPPSVGAGGGVVHQSLQQQQHHPSAAAAGGGYGMMGAMNHHHHHALQQQSGGKPPMMGPAGLHRVPSSGALQQQQLQQQMMSPNSQQHITPPPYVRSAAAAQQSPLHHQQQQAFVGGGVGAVQPPGQQQQHQERFGTAGTQPQQVVQQHHTKQQQQRLFQQQQQIRVLGHQAMNNNDMQLIMNRFKEASQRGNNDEMERFFSDLRKTPHMFNAFLKLTKKQGVSFSGEPFAHQHQPQGGAATQPQQQHFVQPQSTFYQPNQPQQNGGNIPSSQFGGPFQQQMPSHSAGTAQWMQPPNQSQQQSAASQRNSS